VTLDILSVNSSHTHKLGPITVKTEEMTEG
jgi:hypothetical protein